MSLAEFLSQPVWHRLGLTLVHFLWQGLAVAVLVYAAVRILRLKRGNPRYVAYLLAFVAMTVSPPLTFTILDAPAPPASSRPRLSPEMESSGPVASPLSSELAPPRGETMPTAHATHPVPLRQRFDRALQASLPWALVGWMGGVLILSVRLLLGFLGVCRWRRHVEPLAEDLETRIGRLSERLGLPGFRRVFTSRQAQEVVALGYLRPMVLLPAALVTQMQPEMLEAIIAHELAHIRRYDLWVNLAQRIVETLLFYHPAVWWLSRRLRNERELCCDELAVQATGERLTYASALEIAGRTRLTARQPVLALGLGRGKQSTLGRVRHVLGLPPLPPDSRFWLAGVITVALLALVAMPAVSVLTARAANQSSSDSAGADLVFGNPTNLGPVVNSSVEEYDPSISADDLELYFNSYRPGGLGQADLWVTTRKTKADPWGKPVNLGPTVNSPAGDKAPCISADGLSLYFSSDRPGGYGGLDLWVATRNTKSAPWGKPVNLGPTINSPASEHAPSISTDELELYFTDYPLDAPTRPAGLGQGDLWVTTRKTKADPWGKPVNLGPTINSSAWEQSPSLSRDGLSLYFDNDSDIWVTKRKSTGDPWGTPVKLGPVVNRDWTVNPDISKDGSTLYFVSIRPGGVGGADLWQATLGKSTPESKAAELAASLHEAVEAGGIEQVRSLLSQGAGINATDTRGWTPLHGAVVNGHRDIVQLLLEKGADIDAKDQNGYTPLFRAIGARHPDIVKLLVTQGADVNVTVARNYAPLHFAVWYGNLDIVRLLVGHGAKLGAKDQAGWTALRHAAARGKRDLVEFFVTKGVDLPALHVAAGTGDLARVKTLIEQGAGVDAKDELGWTPLPWAMSLGRTEAARLLIASGASVQGEANDLGTPLQQATQIGDRELVTLMLSKGADVTAKTKSGMTPLHRAVGAGHREIAELLIAKGADVNAKTSDGQTPLDVAVMRDRIAIAKMLAAKGAEASTIHVATRMGDLTRVKTLLDQGADINTKDNSGRTALHYAARDGFKEIVEILLAKGADVNAGDRESQTAAEYAMRNNHKEVVELLISKGADISPLHWALHRRDLAKAKDLIEDGAAVNKRTPFGTTPLDMAARAGFRDVAELLIAKGADVNAKLNWAWTPLHSAAEDGHVDVVELLVAKGADVNAKDPRGRTPLDVALQADQRAVVEILAAKNPGGSTLHVAAATGNLARVKMLLQQGANVNAEAGQRTALHYAAEGGFKEIVEVLLANGANVNTGDAFGRTAAQYALSHKHTEIVELLISKGAADISPLHWAVHTRDLAQVRDLIEKGADVNKRTQYGTSPLHMAVNGGLKDIAALLIDKGADVNAKENWAWTPLHSAAGYGDKDMVEMLIAKGADVNAKDPWGRTPLWYAREKAHASIVDLLQKHGAKE